MAISAQIPDSVLKELVVVELNISTEMSGIVRDKQQCDGFYDEIVARRVIREEKLRHTFLREFRHLLILKEKSAVDSLDGSPKSRRCRFAKEPDLSLPLLRRRDVLRNKRNCLRIATETRKLRRGSSGSILLRGPRDKCLF